jgi:hypothetical protein
MCQRLSPTFLSLSSSIVSIVAAAIPYPGFRSRGLFVLTSRNLYLHCSAAAAEIDVQFGGLEGESISKKVFLIQISMENCAIGNDYATCSC